MADQSLPSWMIFTETRAQKRSSSLSNRLTYKMLQNDGLFSPAVVPVLLKPALERQVSFIVNALIT